MPKYMVHGEETVYYLVEVEANSKEEAIELVRNGEIDFGEPVDGEGWRITSAELREDELGLE